MKSVLISIKPKYCELIASGKKIVEVRKTKPKLETPFKVYIYCTKDYSLGEFYTSQDDFADPVQGKVIGEFVCDRVIGTCPWRLKGETGWCAKRTEEETNLPNNACLTLEEIEQYAGSRGRGIYAWHITELVVYDEPRELSDFKHECNGICIDTKKQIKCDRFQDEIQNQEFSCDRLKPITRAPQSWQFCVATEPRQTADREEI